MNTSFSPKVVCKCQKNYVSLLIPGDRYERSLKESLHMTLAVVLTEPTKYFNWCFYGIFSQISDQNFILTDMTF